MNLPMLDRPVDNTAQSAYMNCPREFLFSMVLHRRAREVKPALSFGSIWHKILECHYKSGADVVHVEDSVREWHSKTPQSPVGTDYRTLERALSDYKGPYLKKWPLAKDIKSTIGFPSSPMVEISTSIQGNGLAAPYAGKIDRFVEEDLCFIEDHKTTSRKDKYYFEQFQLSNQMMGYTFIGGLLVPDRRIVGVRINLYHVLTNESGFDRQLITFSQSQLEGWRDNYNKWVARIKLDYWAWRIAQGEDYGDLGLSGELADFIRAAGIEPFPAHFGDNGCSRKFGRCTYFNVCSLPPRVQMKALEQDFDVVPWNPLEVDDD